MWHVAFWLTWPSRLALETLTFWTLLRWLRRHLVDVFARHFFLIIGRTEGVLTGTRAVAFYYKLAVSIHVHANFSSVAHLYILSLKQNNNVNLFLFYLRDRFLVYALNLISILQNTFATFLIKINVVFQWTKWWSQQWNSEVSLCFCVGEVCILLFSLLVSLSLKLTSIQNTVRMRLYHAACSSYTHYRFQICFSWFMVDLSIHCFPNMSWILGYTMNPLHTTHI